MERKGISRALDRPLEDSHRDEREREASQGHGEGLMKNLGEKPGERGLTRLGGETGSLSEGRTQAKLLRGRAQGRREAPQLPPS